MDLIAEAKKMVAQGRHSEGWALIGKSKDGVQIARNISNTDLCYGIYELAKHDKYTRTLIIATVEMLKAEMEGK